MNGVSVGTCEDTCVAIRPNNSLSWRQAFWCLAGISAVSITLAGALALQGYWVVLPFSLLSIVAFGAGLGWSFRAGFYREVITFDGATVRVEYGLGRPQHWIEFNRAWLRVRLEPARDRLRAKRLVLTAAGTRCELGACLTEKEREALARRLRVLTGPALTRQGR